MDEAEKLARELLWQYRHTSQTHERLEREIAAALRTYARQQCAKMRERAAQVAENIFAGDYDHSQRKAGAAQVAAAIRTLPVEGTQ